VGSRAAEEAVYYCSQEAHQSVVRAVEVIGLGRNAIRKLPLDDRRRLRPDALEQAIAADRADGVIPVAVIATGERP
jgi:aromatic-L-amino-acid/L-tryptophan decarboxylase